MEAKQRAVKEDRPGFPTVNELVRAYAEDNIVDDHSVGCQGVAEISFKVGVQKVADWVESHKVYMAFHCEKEWQDFLKENGLGSEK